MRRSIHFFATKFDLEGVFEQVESQRALKYVEEGMADTPVRMIVTSGSQIPNLGFAPSGDSNLEPVWLVLDSSAGIKVVSIPQIRGGVRYKVEHGHTPVFIWPGGVYDNFCVVAGHVETGVVNEFTKNLFELFSGSIRDKFTRIREFWVGHEAQKLFDSGYRLTQSIGAPRESDLSLT